MNTLSKPFQQRRMSWVYGIALIMFFSVLGFTLYQPGAIKLPPADKNNAGLILPDGFEALSVVDSLGGGPPAPGARGSRGGAPDNYWGARHLAVNSNGDIYVKIKLNARAGGFGNVALRDTNGDGKADIITPFDKYEGDISANQQYGTAMKIHNGYLYFSSTLRVYRQKLIAGELVPTSPVEIIVQDTGSTHAHQTKPVAFDGKGYMYVGWGAGSDDCQIDNRSGSLGQGKAEPVIPGEGCPLMKDHGGIWKFSESKPNQRMGDGLRYATGLRSIVGMDWDTKTNSLYAVMHGRDYLNRNFPTMYSLWESALLPADEFFKVHQGLDGGYPYYYYDQMRKQKYLNPEYGGDKKKIAPAHIDRPILGFPGHFAPNDVYFYKGNQFPARYKEGAFVALHGSTIRNPYPQAGYFIMFVPMKNGVVSGEWEVFANGFTKDPIIDAGTAGYRPMGITEGPDGSLYISETEKGKIWRVMFKGNKATFGPAQLAKMVKNKATATNVKTPDPVKDNVDLILGKPVVAATVYSTYCLLCHQRSGMGDGTRFPPLGGSDFVNGDKNKLIGIVLNGLQGSIEVKGVTYNEIMPAHSAMLNDVQVAEVLTYVRSNFGNTSGPVTAAEVATVRKATSK